MWSNLVAIFICMLAGISSVHASKEGKWVDLTHDFSKETIYWPTSDKFDLETVYEGTTEKGYYYSAYKFSTSEHGGTHIDAPIHFFDGGHTVDQIPVNQLIGEGVVIRVLDQVRSDRNYQIKVADIKAWESKHGQIPEQSIVLFDTGSSKLWPDAEQYMGTDKRGGQKESQSFNFRAFIRLPHCF